MSISRKPVPVTVDDLPSENQTLIIKRKPLSPQLVQGSFLDVPVTESERRDANRRRSRANSTDSGNLDGRSNPFDDGASVYSQGSTLSRFPSIHGQNFTPIPTQPAPIRHIPPLPSSILGSGRHGYTSVSPIAEEEDDDLDEDDDEGSRFPSRTSNRPSESHSYTPMHGLSQPSVKFWTPFWLKQFTLGGFVLLFAACVGTLLALFFLSRNNNGFAVSSDTSREHYAWTYTPPAILILMVALWRQVDYHTKSLVPWDELQDGPVAPGKSLFLDYISPFQLVSLFKSLQRGHMSVTASVIAFVLLKIATLFSTGLMVVLPTTTTQNGLSLSLTRKFDTTGFNAATDLQANTFPSGPIYTYYGSMSQGLPLSAGTTFDLAYTPFSTNSTSVPANSTVSAQVTAFVPTMNCRALDVKVDGPSELASDGTSDPYGSPSVLSLLLPDGTICQHWSPINVTVHNPLLEIVPQSVTQGRMQELFCAIASENLTDTSKGPVGLLFTLTEVTYQQTLFDNASALVGGSFVIASNTSRTVARMTNVFCQPDYVMTSVKVSNDTSSSKAKEDGITIDNVPSASNTTLGGLSAWNMTTMFKTAIDAAGPLLGDPFDEDLTSQASNSLFSMLVTTQGTSDLTVLFDDAKLSDAAQKTYKGVAAQYAQQQLTSPSNDPVSATVVRVQNRLVVNNISLWIMVACFTFSAIASAFLVFISPRGVVPRNPNSIAASATVLARSHDFNRLLRREGLPSHESQVNSLTGFEFGTALATTDDGQSAFKIVTSAGEPDGGLQAEPVYKWWVPLGLKIPSVIGIALLPVILIAILAVLQRLSDNRNGIMSVGDNEEVEIFTHYIPALVMLIFASAVNAFEFNIVLFTPWSKLIKHKVTAKQSITSNLMGKSLPLAALEALKARQMGAVFSLFAAACASLLTILVSGLYTVEHTTSTNQPLSLDRLDTFNLQWPSSVSNDKGAAAVVNLIAHQAVSYPEFTYGDLVFPKFALSHNDTANNIQSNMITLPALRANLKCDILPQSALSMSTQAAGDASAFPTDQAFVSVIADLPASCQLAGTTGSDSTVFYQHSFTLSPNGQETFAGQQFDLVFGTNATFFGNFGEDNAQYVGDSPPVGCPSLAFTFGQFQLGKDDTSKVTSMICYQQIEQLNANVTLSQNSTKIDPANPPIPDEQSVALQKNPNSTTGVDTFDFRIQLNLARAVQPFDNSSSFDIFFQAALDGINKTDPTTLIGQDEQNGLLTLIQNFYRLYMAQAINANMRAPISASNSRLKARQSNANQLAVISTTSGSPRLVQHRETAIALQVLLGLIMVTVFLAYITTATRRVLPCNPCSIAGTMALLAGSDLAWSHDDGVCECCGRPRRRSMLHQNAPESIAAGEDETADVTSSDGDRRQFIPDGAEWLDDKSFSRIFANHRYSLCWWSAQLSLHRRRRYGVDVGTGTDDEWELGLRRPRTGEFGIGEDDGRNNSTSHASSMIMTENERGRPPPMFTPPSHGLLERRASSSGDIAEEFGRERARGF